MPNPNSKDPTAVVDPLDPETQPAQQDEVFTEEIDLGNGNVLKFEAPTQDELREKIFGWMRDKATAAPSPAIEGTQPGAAGSQPAPAKKPKKLTKDEAFAIDTEFKSGSPIKALRDYVEKVYGTTLDQIVENAEAGGEYS